MHQALHHIVDNRMYNRDRDLEIIYTTKIWNNDYKDKIISDAEINSFSIHWTKKKVLIPNYQFLPEIIFIHSYKCFQFTF